MGNELKKLLPFLEEEEVNEIAKKILGSETGEWKGLRLEKVLPFLDSENVDELFAKAIEGGKEYDSFLPFVSENALHERVMDVIEGRSDLNLDKMYPFMSEDDIKKVFYYYLDKEE